VTVDSFDAIAAHFGRLDVLINNAGITRDALLLKAKDSVIVAKMSLAQWDAVVKVNLTGVFLCGREAAEHMIRHGNGGVIINISSISREGNAGQTNYSAAKAGVAAMSVVWAKELARHGIRSAAIAPGFCATDILASMKPEVLPADGADACSGRDRRKSPTCIVENTLLGRVIESTGVAFVAGPRLQFGRTCKRLGDPDLIRSRSSPAAYRDSVATARRPVDAGGGSRCRRQTG
jgi:3-oxoacyl-[acyl-carrier protein] reductase